MCSNHCLKGVPKLETVSLYFYPIDIYDNNLSPQHIIKVISQQFIRSPCYIVQSIVPLSQVRKKLVK